jgi:predicted PolB exonuclease-like 3'-5' exonuclease
VVKKARVSGESNLYAAIWAARKTSTTMITHVYFDIETGPAENATDFEPQFEAPKNIKDPAKIEAALAEKRADWLDRLALSAVTGQVLAVGMVIGDGEITTLASDDERTLLLQLWMDLHNLPSQGDHRLVGWNLTGFDLPFLLRRSWVHNIPVPEWIFYSSRRLSDFHIDLMRVWCGENPQDRISLDTVSRLFGVGKKSGSGKDFAKLWKEDWQAALAYLHQDVELTRAVARRMGK